MFTTQAPLKAFCFRFWIFLEAFAANSYLGFNKNLLSSLGDDDNVYTRLFCALLPASIFFAPLYGMSLNRKGFAFTFAITLALGLLWSSITLIPSLPVQMVAFLAFTNYRALLYSAYFTFIAHSFGSRTMGAVNAQLAALGAVLTYSIGACTEFSESWFGNLRGMSGTHAYPANPTWCHDSCLVMASPEASHWGRPGKRLSIGLSIDLA